MQYFCYASMDLFGVACRGEPLSAVADSGDSVRFWSGAVGPWTVPYEEFSLFLERKELQISQQFRWKECWWYWHLGFEGRLDPRATKKKNWLFWMGLAYSPPRPGLSLDVLHNLLNFGVSNVIEFKCGPPNQVIDNGLDFDMKSKLGCAFVRGVPVAEIAARPYYWLASVDDVALKRFINASIYIEFDNFVRLWAGRPYVLAEMVNSLPPKCSRQLLLLVAHLALQYTRPEAVWLRCNV